MWNTPGLSVRWVRIYCFVQIVVASLPYIWLLVEFDWRNMHVFPISCWLYVPIGIWFVPTISFVADTIAMGNPRGLWYIGRSSLECLLMVPWMYAWIVISFFMLGGGWI